MLPAHHTLRRIQQYEALMQNWSEQAATVFLKQIEALPFDLTGDILECGCGSGALTASLQQRFRPRQICALDLSAQALLWAQKRVPEALFYHADALDLPFPNARFYAVLSGLLLPYLSDAEWALREWQRVSRPEALLAAYYWADGAFPFTPYIQLLRAHRIIAEDMNFSCYFNDLWQKYCDESASCEQDLAPLPSSAESISAFLQAFELEHAVRQHPDYALIMRDLNAVEALSGRIVILWGRAKRL